MSIPRFKNAEGVAVAPDGNVYVADSNNYRIQVFTSEGVFLRKWGTEGAGDGQFRRAPSGITVASDGSVYVTNSSSPSRIQRFTPEGVFVSKWGNLANGLEDWSWSATDIAVTSDGSAYVVDRGNHRIQKFSVGQ